MKRLRDTRMKKLNSIVQFTGMGTITGRLAQGGFLRGDLPEIVDGSAIRWPGPGRPYRPIPALVNKAGTPDSREKCTSLPKTTSRWQDLAIVNFGFFTTSSDHIFLRQHRHRNARPAHLLFKFHICQPLKSGATYSTSQHWSCIKRRDTQMHDSQTLVLFSALVLQVFLFSLFHVFSR